MIPVPRNHLIDNGTPIEFSPINDRRCATRFPTGFLEVITLIIVSITYNLDSLTGFLETITQILVSITHFLHSKPDSLR